MKMKNENDIFSINFLIQMYSNFYKLDVSHKDIEFLWEKVKTNYFNRDGDRFIIELPDFLDKYDNETHFYIDVRRQKDKTLRIYTLNDFIKDKKGDL
jgi:hypothetical protein